MAHTLAHSWESDNSQFQLRRRACLSGRGGAPDRLAVLLVEGDPEIARALVEALTGQPVETHLCAEPARALLAVGRACPDVVVLGPATGLLGAEDFLTLVREVDGELPVVAGAGPGSGDFAARAAELGATAVVPRPYHPRQLLGLLRSFAPRPDRVVLRPLGIDLGRLRVDGAVPRFWLDGQTVQLPPMEFLLLRYLAERAGAVLTRRELIAAVWGEGATARSNTLTVHIMRLRKRLGDDEHDPQWIKAVRGLGYQFTVPPRAE
ncbi:response regulator transcription factor [Amycolatopsis cihanbeyliensis]|uniref:DNA-binding response OmpR family regulator n=1 Tax=Amycolatopsis cihanbeyliensis TaxID=1128664 RepID=A0A542DF42_AMYCI|nr:response regulator transcription factor [Amycolatopsis cihanbeyliensis]TQJ01684.1 DNA-binding response OmpR family regulator [Amycolatopsis cihanbeyliensis]